MDLYDAFKYIIEKNDIKILDDASKCERLLKQQGVNGEDLNVRLFFAVLKENVPLKIRTSTYSNKNFTNYTLSIKVFCDLFGGEKLSNEYEDILIRHISLIVSVFEAEKVINLNMQAEQTQNGTVSLSKAVKKALKRYDLSVLESPKQLKSILDDFCADKSDVLEFIGFLERMNNGTIDLDNQQEVDNIKKFAKVLGNRGYLPLIIVQEKLKTREAPQEEKEELSGDNRLDSNNTDFSEKTSNLDVNTTDTDNASDNENESKRIQPTKESVEAKKSEKKLTKLFAICAGVFSLILVILAIDNQDNNISNYSSTHSYSYNSNSSGSTTTSTSATRTLYVKVDGLNVRSEASADSRIVGVLGQGDSVTTSSPASKKWIYVSGKYHGYVNSDYLSEYPVNNTSNQDSRQKNNENSTDDINENLDLSPKNMKSKE